MPAPITTHPPNHPPEQANAQAAPQNISDQTAPQPLRETLSPEVMTAARTIHRAIWKSPYHAGQGPMHYAGGPYWRGALLRQSDEWERLAEAARICAGALPNA